MIPLSVVFITLNEEENLPKALEVLPNGVEIIIVDSQSTDRTKEVARSFGAKVYDEPFENFGTQKNKAVSYATRPWVLSLDADEVCDERLLASVLEICKQPLESVVCGGYKLERKLVFMNRKMHFGKTKDHPLRFFLREKAKFEGKIHEKVQLLDNLSIGVLKGTLWHYSYKDLADYMVRFNSYTSKIASQQKKLTKMDFVFHLLRPWVEFFSRYVLRLGFLDGYPGYTYALLSSLYAYMKYAKYYEKNGL